MKIVAVTYHGGSLSNLNNNQNYTYPPPTNSKCTKEAIGIYFEYSSPKKLLGSGVKISVFGDI